MTNKYLNEEYEGVSISEYVALLDFDDYMKTYAVYAYADEPIIRCRDCKVIGCPLFAKYGDPNGFCAWGERSKS